MSISRRDFLGSTSSCAAHLALLSTIPPGWTKRAWASRPVGTVAAREPFGTLKKIADGVWALISNPLGGDMTTVCNGGIIAGRNGVIAVEGFYKPEGAAWIAGKARELTGKRPTHVAITHYHADHANGVAGYLTTADHPALRATARTRSLVVEKNGADAARAEAMQGVTTIAMDQPSTVDLGGVIVRFVPQDGHTASDVSIELDEPSIVFCGDLVWNGMVPNYVDAVPSRLSAAVRAMRRGKATLYVPGHGPLAREAEYDRYVAVIDEIEKAARAGRAAGKTAAETAAGFQLPDSLGKWTLFNPQYFDRAIGAWYKELTGG